MKNILKNQLVTNLILFALVFLVAYCLGLNIINLINRRLENISITMPKIEVGVHYDPTTGRFITLPQTHYKASTEIESPNQLGGGGPSSVGGANYEQSPGMNVGMNDSCSECPGLMKQPTIEMKHLTNQPMIGCSEPASCKSAVSGSGCGLPPLPTVPTTSSGQSSTQCRSPLPNMKGPDNKISQSLCQDIKTAKEACDPNQIVCDCNSDCNKVYGQGANQCINGKCQCRFGTGKFCQQQPTYYLDPKNMTPAQVVKFKNRAKLSVMTLQDYKNWLSLFEFEVDTLPLVHRVNYWKMVKGDQITIIPTEEDIGVNDGWQSPGYTVDANGTTIPNAMPEDVREYRSNGGRVPQADMNIDSDGLIETKIRFPAAEVDSQYNYKFLNRDDSTGNIKDFAETRTPLAYTAYDLAFNSNRKYTEYSDKVVPFKTTLVSSWFQNNAPALSDLVESSAYNPLFRCNS